MILELLHNTGTTTIKNCPLDSATQNCKTNLPQVAANQATIQTALSLVFGVIGFVAVIIIIIAGFQYVISQGDSQAMAKARQTIIYAGVGLAVVFSAEAVILTVFSRL